MSVSKTRPAVPENAPVEDVYAPQPLTFRANVIMTLKVLAVLAVVGGALWAVKLWTMAG